MTSNVPAVDARARRAGDPRAFVVFRRDLCRPCEAANADQGPAQIERGHRHQQVPERDLRDRIEDGDGRQPHDRQADHDPETAATVAGRSAVGERTDQGVGDDVGHPTDEQDHTDRRQAEAELRRVVGGQIDCERKPAHGERDAEQGKGRQLSVLQAHSRGFYLSSTTWSCARQSAFNFRSRRFSPRSSMFRVVGEVVSRRQSQAGEAIEQQPDADARLLAGQGGARAVVDAHPERQGARRRSSGARRRCPGPAKTFSSRLAAA